ncbi:MAG: hypothetical protein HY247_08330 [archaeon]|nr:MAG: hypothetical protein HY247_08330 [archaeon]
MERPQPLGIGIVEKCRECRGVLAQAGQEVACTNCGVVARREGPIQEVKTASRAGERNRLGSYMGTKADEGSNADYNGVSTVGFLKTISDHMGEDQAAWKCTSLIERVAERLSLPTFVKANAVVLSGKMLAERKSDGGPRRRTTVPAISAYSLLCACRAAGIDHISAKSVIQAHTDLGHRVTKSLLLRLGTESRVPLRSADPQTLLQTVIGSLESNAAVAERLKRHGIEPRQYFRRLLQASATVVTAVREVKEGNSPRTVAATSVYLASLEVQPKTLTQRDVAETLGVAEYTIREFSSWARSELGPLNGGGA